MRGSAMGSTLAFGSYVARESAVHGLNAQVKVILTCLFSIAAFLVDGWAGMGILVAAVAVLYAVAHVNVARAARGLLPVAFILVFTIVVHAFSLDVTSPTAPGLANTGSLGLTVTCTLFGTFGLTLDGLVVGLYFALRIALLVALCSLLTSTTTMMELTDAMLVLLGPLRHLRVPVDDIAMMVSIALRFIPTTAEEAFAIQKAQKARCADFDEGSLLKRLRAWASVLVPLFVRLFRRADELADAMDARCYGIGPRTHASRRPLSAGDVAVGIVFAAGLVVVCVAL